MQLINIAIYINNHQDVEIFHCSVVSLHHHGILAGSSDKELLLQKRALALGILLISSLQYI